MRTMAVIQRSILQKDHKKYLELKQLKQAFHVSFSRVNFGLSLVSIPSPHHPPTPTPEKEHNFKADLYYDLLLRTQNTPFKQITKLIA